MCVSVYLYVHMSGYIGETLILLFPQIHLYKSQGKYHTYIHAYIHKHTHMYIRNIFLTHVILYISYKKKIKHSKQ